MLEEKIRQAWRQKNWLFYCVLVPLSWLFALITVLRRYAYQKGFLKSHALTVPVIVVGNINMGGSGKTPVVIWLVAQLKLQGYTPGVISRGYGGSIKLPTLVNVNSQPAQVGDEPVLIANRCDCPVYIGADRVQAGFALLKAYPQCDVIISDDGLQHYRLQRAFEIIVLDASLLPETANLLPAGPLRETAKRLQTVDAIILNVAGLEATFDSQKYANTYQMQLIGEQFYSLANPTLTATVQNFKRKSIKAMAGIGNPERFFEHLRKLGLTFAAASFNDHHAFTQAEIEQQDCDMLIMTEKDAVKCKQFAQAHHWVLPVNAQIDAQLIPQILAKLANWHH